MSGEYNPNSTDEATIADTGVQEVQPVVDVFGTAEEGVNVHSVSTYPATPGGNEYRPERNPAAQPVEVTLEGPSGEVLHRTTVPDRVGGSHGHGHAHPTVAASLPFPFEGVKVVLEHNDVKTHVNPIVAPLRFALLDVSPEAFEEGESSTNALSPRFGPFDVLSDVFFDGENSADVLPRRSSLLRVLRRCDAQMRQGRYDVAADTLAEEFATGVKEGIESYEAYANETKPEQLLALTDRMVERLRWLPGET